MSKAINLHFPTSLRQLLQPREFRIAGFAWPPELGATLQALTLDGAPDSGPARENVTPGSLAEIGTGLWRLQRKMLQPGTDQPLEEMRRAYRYLESTLAALERANVRIRDHTGEKIPDTGILQLKVLAYQPQAGVTGHQVQETIKPSIYFKDQMIQMGEVIVSIPEGE
jgi:hypothetical protein